MREALWISKTDLWEVHTTGCLIRDPTTQSSLHLVYPPVFVTNEGLGWDSLQKKTYSCGDWHPGWGVVAKYTLFPAPESSQSLLPLWQHAPQSLRDAFRGYCGTIPAALAKTQPSGMQNCLKSSSQRSWHLDDFHLCFDIIADLGARVEMGLGWGFLQDEPCIYIYIQLYLCMFILHQSFKHPCFPVLDVELHEDIYRFLAPHQPVWDGAIQSVCWFSKQIQYHLESRWLATPIGPGWSWPLTNRHLLGVAIAIYFHHSVIHLFITAMVISTEILSLQIAPHWKIGWGTSPF